MSYSKGKAIHAVQTAKCIRLNRLRIPSGGCQQQKHPRQQTPPPGPGCPGQPEAPPPWPLPQRSPHPEAPSSAAPRPGTSHGSFVGGEGSWTIRHREPPKTKMAAQLPEFRFTDAQQAGGGKQAGFSEWKVEWKEKWC